MGRCRGVPFEFPTIIIRLLRSPRRAGGRTNKMNSNTYLNNNYKSNERALADLLGQLVRGRNNSPPGFNRGGLGGSSGGSGPINTFGGSSMGPSGGGGGSGIWGGNAPNDWSQGGSGGGGGGVGGRGYGSSVSGGSGVGGYGNSGNGGGSGGYGNSGSGNMMPLMHRGGGGGGGGFGGLPQGSGMHDGYGSMPQGGGMNNNFGGMQQSNNYMGMSGGNQGGYGGMPPNRAMNNGGFGVSGGGGGVFPQNDSFGGGGFDDCPPPPLNRSRGTWVSGSANRGNRNVAPPPVRNNVRSSSSTQDRRNISGPKSSLATKGSRSGGASATGHASKPVQAQKRKAPPSAAPPAKSSPSTNNAKPTTSAQGSKTAAAEPRRVLTTTGGRWYQYFLSKGLKPEEARKKAFENNNKPFTAGAEGAAAKKTAKQTNPPSAELYTRLAIFAKGFPEVILETDDLCALEERIVDEVANSSTESKLQFERLLRKPGVLVFDCANQKTADWLTDIIPKLANWDGAELVVCKEEDIPEVHIMTLHLPRSAGQDYDQTLSLIQAQNSDLNTESWEWVEESEDLDTLILTIRVDKESHAAIKEKRWKIFYKFGLVEVNFVRYLRYALSKRLNEEANASKSEINKGEEDKDTTAETTEENPPSPPPAPIISK